MKRARPVAASLALAVTIAACGTLASPAPTAERPLLGISNGTTLDVSLFVNDVLVGEYPAGGPVPAIRTADLPALPWAVEARSVSGRVLTSMRVEPGQVWSTTRPDGVMASSGAIGRVDLSCGRLTIWAGDRQPSGPAPNQSPGEPGDCEP